MNESARAVPSSHPPAELVEAYRRTTYAVHGSLPIELRVDRAVPGLVEWLSACLAQRAIVITAFNPFSVPLSDGENVQRSGELLSDILAHGLACVGAAGQGEDPAWAPESSYCVFDPPGALIDEWMQRFGQYAVVVADRVDGCSLLWHPTIRAGELS